MLSIEATTVLRSARLKMSLKKNDGLGSRQFQLLISITDRIAIDSELAL